MAEKYDHEALMTSVWKSWEIAQHRPWETWIGSIPITPNCWYIGDNWVGVILIKTDAGLIMIDTGMTGQVHLIFEAIRELGFRPKDIKLILLTHGHFDHVGGLNFIRAYTGAKVGAPKEDLEALQGSSEKLDNRGEYYLPVTPDFFYNDSEPVSIGNLEIQTMHTPGHTPGTTALFFHDVGDNGRKLRVGILGGVGMNGVLPSTPDEDITPFLKARTDLRNSLERLACEYVDVTVAIHPGTCDMLLTAARATEKSNPFIDSKIWVATIKKYTRRLDDIEGR